MSKRRIGSGNRYKNFVHFFFLDDLEEHNLNHSSSVNVLPTPATPEFPRDDGVEIVNTVEPSREIVEENQVSSAFPASLSKPDQGTDFGETENIPEHNNERFAANYVDNKISDEDILEVIFVSLLFSSNISFKHMFLPAFLAFFVNFVIFISFRQRNQLRRPLRTQMRCVVFLSLVEFILSSRFPPDAVAVAKTTKAAHTKGVGDKSQLL